ncbi:MAG: hypothetical protein ACYDB2_03795 [Acidimicrobiales bacterium]
MTESLNSRTGEHQSRTGKRVLHVVVGHGLRTYFMNAVRSVRSVAPDDEILVVDNASPDHRLRAELSNAAAGDPKIRLLLRDSNDLANTKVGGLYGAYRDAFDVAMQEQFDYAHIVQGDSQVLWWDDDVLSRATDLFASDPRCVNIFMSLLSNDRAVDEEFREPRADHPPKLRQYGLTDSGLYDLHRWRKFDISFADDELVHAKRYLSEGFSVLCHLWPTDAQIPWPAVVRHGVQLGREVNLVKPFLLKPMSLTEVEELKARNWTWLEDVCVPWGWTCMTPMWTTHLNPDYLANRRREASERGIIRSLPKWERRGLDDSSWLSVLRSQHRPSMWKLFVVVPVREISSRLRRRLRQKAT